jgi:hypothetical protein
LTIADFVIAERAYYFETLFPKELHEFPFFKNIRNNFNTIPAICAYYKRKDAIKGPFIPSTAVIAPQIKPVVLGYWAIRGLAQVPRLLLSYTGVEFEDRHYVNSDKWFKDDKVHLGLDFPNLPYLID